MSFRHTITISFYLLTLLPTTALFSQSKKAEKAQNKAINANLRKYIPYLASDSLEGRRTGTAGEVKAAAYIQAQYEQLGIAPGNTGRYMQEFDIEEGKWLTPESKVSVDDKELERNKHFFAMAWGGKGEIKISTSVALHEAGAPWWVDMKEAMENNVGNPHFVPTEWLKDAAKKAVKKGATALLVYNSGNKDDSMSYRPKDKTTVTAIPIIYFTKKAVAELSLDASSSPYVDLNIDFVEKSRKARNVVAYIDNSAATTVIIGAHFDHLGYGEDSNSRYTGSPAVHNGADDNASGTAAVLELARILKEKSDASKATKKGASTTVRNNNYLFVHFTAEELGLIGSKYYVEHPVQNLTQTNYMINIDMIGRLDLVSHMLTVGGIGTSPAWGNAIQNIAVKDLEIKADSSGTGPSDYTSFYRKDIPVIFFFTGLHKDYHTPYDDADEINYAGETSIITYILKVVENAGSQPKLAFAKTKEQTMVGTRYKVSIGIMPDYAFSGQGVRADAVIDGRPSQKAGMVAGDVIVQLGDYPVDDVESYMQALNKFDKGQTTTVKIKRGKDTKELKVTFDL